MAKRFIDTDFFRAPFVRGLPAPYKGLYMFIICDCDHAGIWVPDFEIARILLGYSEKEITREKTREFFKDVYVELPNGKWFFPDIIDQQNPRGLIPGNRAHDSIINRLKKYDLIDENLNLIKPLKRGYEGCKDMDKETDKDKEQETEEEKPQKIEFSFFWDLYDKKVSRKKTQVLWDKLSFENQSLACDHAAKYRIAQPQKQYRKNPDTYLRNECWNDEIIFNSEQEKQYKQYIQRQKLSEISKRYD